MTTAVLSRAAEGTRASWRAAAVPIALCAIVAAAALSYAGALNQVVLEPYYAAAVRSMASSWRNFAFGTFDQAGTVTLDKLPGALWLQALTARVFGVHTWTLVLPQVVEGTLTVLVLYRAVRRLAGPAAGLTAAFVLAASPAVVALNRGNIPDTLMILLLVLAADAVSSALVAGSQRRLVMAAVWVGLAFHAKMLEAWLLLPALGLAYLAAAPGSGARRARQVIGAGAVAGAVSLLWIIAVMLVPADARPHVDGSPRNSLFEQVFVYNGLGRVGGQTPLQVLARQGVALGLEGPSPGWNRLLIGELGRTTGWLIPAALMIAVTGIIAVRRRPRGDRMRAAYLLWGAWLLTLLAAFSLASSIQAYYTAALAPAIAALVGIGLAHAWAARSSVWARLVPAVLAAGSAGYAVWLLPSSGTGLPSWLAAATAVVGVAAVVELLTSSLRRSDDTHARIALGAALAALVFVPTIASTELVVHRQGVYDTPFQPSRKTASIDALFVDTPALIARSLPELEAARAGAPILVAVQSAAVASVFAHVSGEQVLAIGGFTATMPTPTLTELQTTIARGDLHLVLLFPNSPDPRAVWISQHCRLTGTTARFLRNYYCTPAAAASS